MKNIKKLVARGLMVGVVAGLFVADFTVCKSIGTSIKENRIEQAKVEAKERYKDTLIGFGENVLSPIVEEEKVDRQAKEQLKKDLQEDAIKHKNDKPVQAITKELTKDEKDNLGRG